MRTNIKAADVFEQRATIPTAGKLTALQKAQAYVDRGCRDAWEVACKTFQTHDRDLVSGLPRPSLRFEAFIGQVQELIDATQETPKAENHARPVARATKTDTRTRRKTAHS
jgi:hypothetical protein